MSMGCPSCSQALPSHVAPSGAFAERKSQYQMISTAWKMKRNLQGDDMSSATQWKVLSPSPFSPVKWLLSAHSGWKGWPISFNMLNFSWCKKKRKKNACRLSIPTLKIQKVLKSIFSFYHHNSGHFGVQGFQLGMFNLYSPYKDSNLTRSKIWKSSGSQAFWMRNTQPVYNWRMKGQILAPRRDV